MKVELVIPTPAPAGHAPEPVLRVVTAHAAAAPALHSAAEPDRSVTALKAAARQINDYLRQSSSAVVFRVDESSGQVIVRVVDSESNQVIRQIPSEEMLAIEASLDRVSGLLLRQTA